MSDESLTYAESGVDIDKANEFVGRIKEIAKETKRSGALGDIGGFGGLFSLNLSNYRQPVLVSSADGVGTKLKVAFLMDKHDTIGMDLVAMCVNDIAAQGAKPLFFLDYLSMGKLDLDVATRIISGISEGCKKASCALIGGETAEMPGLYREGEYDLAGFSVGIVENDRIIDGSDIHVGNLLVGIASNGLHSNGYSLVRKICFEILRLDVDSYVEEFSSTLGEELLRPTAIYSEALLQIKRDLPINGLAHITGGGLIENLVRILPSGCGIVLNKGSWDVPPVFPFLKKAGNISDQEMLRTFNNGIGMVAIVPEDVAEDVAQRLEGMGEKSFIIGEIVERKESGQRVVWSETF